MQGCKDAVIYRCRYKTDAGICICQENRHRDAWIEGFLDVGIY